MENHPIPQDVTNFQFKLIGNMTIKQFAYLAAGAICGWIFFSLPIFFLIKFLFGFLSVGLGASLAFLPVEGRPFDLMIMYFVKSLFTPNQYLFQKKRVAVFDFNTTFSKQTIKKKENTKSKEQLQELLKTVHKEPKNRLDEKEMIFFQSLSGIFTSQNSAPTIAPALQPAHMPIQQKENQEEKPEEIDRELEIEKMAAKQKEEKAKQQTLTNEAKLLKEQLEKTKTQEIKEKKPELTGAHLKTIELEKQLQEVLAQREQLEKELLQLKQKLEIQNTNVFTPGTATKKEETQHVRQIPRGMEKSAGMPITPDIPNQIMGIIKNPRGNILSNILVEIKDKDGNPVRAFKTNGLGQFASATPLLNGIYTLSFEDPKEQNKFDMVELSATGEIMPVLEIISNDGREELRKALFN